MLAHALAVMGGFTPSIHLRVYRRQAEGPNRNSVFSICRQIGTLLRGKGRIMDFLPFPPSSYLLASQLLFEFPFQFTDRLSFGACFSPSTRVDNLKLMGICGYEIEQRIQDISAMKKYLQKNEFWAD